MNGFKITPPDLTLTRVVFEYIIFNILSKKNKHLTLTRVVFEWSVNI